METTQETRARSGVKAAPDGGATMSATEAMRSVEILRTGSMAEGAAGLGAVVLAILGLAGILPFLLLPISTIAIGAALLFEGGAIAARFSNLLTGMSRSGAQTTELGGGMTAEFLGGAAGVALGILGLLGVLPAVLIPVAAIVFGGSLIFGSAVTTRLNSLEIASSGGHELAQAAAREAVAAAAGVQVLVGLGGIALGIIALIGVAPDVLSLVAMLSIGASVLLSGTAISRRMVGVFRR